MNKYNNSSVPAARKANKIIINPSRINNKEAEAKVMALVSKHPELNADKVFLTFGIERHNFKKVVELWENPDYWMDNPVHLIVSNHQQMEENS